MPWRLWLPLLLLALLLFVWRLGSSGLVDETPPLFRRLGQGHGRDRDWLIPRVNGSPATTSRPWCTG